MKYEYLTIPQQNIWNLQKFYKDTGISNLCGAVFYREKRDSALLQQAIRQFIKNQSALRLRFCEKDGPRQYVEENDIAQIPILYFASRREFDSYAKKLAKDPVGLTDCSMYRFAVFEVENRSGILILLSHLIADAWTFGLMLQQLEKVYRQLQEGEEVSLPESDYRNYIQSEADYLHSERYEKDREYWEKKYENRPEESSVRPQTAPARFIAARRIMRILPTALEQKIRRYCLENSVTQAVLFETTLIVYLSEIHPENKTITIGLPVLNRSSREEKDTAGMFVTTMPFTVDVSGEITVAELTGRISMGHMEMYRHQKYPYTRILKYLREKQNFTGNLYDVMLSYQNAESGADADTQWYGNGYSEVPLAIHIDNRDGKECHTVNVDYQTEVFSDEAEVVSFIDRLEYILEQITSEPSQPVKRIGIVPPAEWRKLIDTFNNTHMEYPKEKCIHELFSQQVARTPDKTALVSGGAAFTYRQLDEMSNALAHFLRKKGVVPGEIVPLIAKRSYHAVTAMLGILKAGGAYMPIDPDYPIERINYMLAEAGSRIGVTYGYQGFVSIETVELEDFDFSGNSTPLSNANSPEDTCYVIFTSGSTGKPKGALLKHSGLVNLCCDSQVFYDAVYRKCGCVLAIGAFTFDISISEMFPMLVHGGKIVLADEQDMSCGKSLAALMLENQVDLFCATPTRLRYYLEHEEFQNAMAGVKVILSAGEAFSSELYDRVRGCTDGEIYNGYGPTETTVGVAFQRVTGDDITIGRPIANTQIYILNQTGTPCPIGVPGELCIAGEGVGKGYLNRPELTAEKFVSNPFANEENGHGKIMYRTGDLARFREDGEIEYLGRMDTQVKIRGLRIELGEIESVMSGFAGISLTAVVAKRDKKGRQYLVGYYTSEEEIDEKKLREYLSQKLPRYMIPNCLMRLEAIPMTSGGKTDRKNLPEPDFGTGETEYEAPVTEKERVICEAISSLLEGRRTGRNDDFFEIGGDSLLAMMLTAVLSDRGVAVSLQDIYEHPTPAQLGRVADQKQTGHVEYRGAEFQKYAEILKSNRQDVSGFRPPERRFYGNVLLTGATGFLGAHLLEGLIERGSGRVYCLVRDASKLEKMLEYYFDKRYAAKIGGEILLVEGDVADADSLRMLPEDVETVIHAAAIVKHYGEYSEFERVNVTGTRNLLAYAEKIRSRFALISTTSVGGAALTQSGNGTTHFTEQNFYIGQDLENVYVRSKFEAERLVLDAMAAGGKCRIFRMGNLTNRYRDGVFQPNFRDNAFLRRILTFLDNGMIPDVLAEETLEMTPVDLAAEAVLTLEESARDWQTVFHIANIRKAVTYRQLAGLLGNVGVRVSLVDAEEFLRKLKANLNRENSSVINEMYEMEAMRGRKRVQTDNAFTDSVLSEMGFCWADISTEYLRKYVEFIINHQ